MRILLASSEVHPYSKTGGLGDAVAALGGALAHAGHDVDIMTPLYRGIREKYPRITPVDWVFDIPMGADRITGNLFALKVSKNLTVYFVDKPEYFDRSGIYNENNYDYSDNAERFIFFSKCIVSFARHFSVNPEVLHLNDWPVAVAALLAKNQITDRNKTIVQPKICFTIHNLAYQGVFPSNAFQLLNLPPTMFNMETIEYYGQINCLKAGLACADSITTVSPRYAREITTQEYGCGLDGLLRKRERNLTGILNGVDYSEWNTEKNPFLVASYSTRDMTGKNVCKQALQKRFSLEADLNVPLFGIVTRLADQKGIDLLVESLQEALDWPMNFVLLGSGSKQYEQALNKIAQKHSGKVGLFFGYDHQLAHQVESGCDFFLMPSRFEPCGLNQLYSLRYGTIPIVRRTGGLDDSVIDATDDEHLANGIKFNDLSPNSLTKAIKKALILFDNKLLLRKYQTNGMLADFSWQKAVKVYELIYR